MEDLVRSLEEQIIKLSKLLGEAESNRKKAEVRGVRQSRVRAISIPSLFVQIMFSFIAPPSLALSPFLCNLCLDHNPPPISSFQELDATHSIISRRMLQAKSFDKQINPRGGGAGGQADSSPEVSPMGAAAAAAGAGGRKGGGGWGGKSTSARERQIPPTGFIM